MLRKILIGVMAAVVITASFDFIPNKVRAGERCVGVKFVWVDGSGAKIDGTDNNYNDFKAAIASEFATTSLDYNFYELGTEAHGGFRYPAEGIGTGSVREFFTMVGAGISGGQSYRYGSSISKGVGELVAYVREVSERCPATRFVIAGLSQGAQVISTALLLLDQAGLNDKIVYVATFGDPKLYLPEGTGGVVSPACLNGLKSAYRADVPDCWVNEGLLGGNKPYGPSTFWNKVGVFCNHYDAVCTGRINFLNLDESLNPHGSYGNSLNADHIYNDAARIIYNRIVKDMAARGTITAVTKNVAILFDTTGSMQWAIDSYKAEATRLAESVWSQGGEVALFEYRDLSDPFPTTMHCGFTTNPAQACTRENFQAELDKMVSIDGTGGDDDESVLPAAMEVMNTLAWKNGADKSIIILTNSGYHNPENGLTPVSIVNRSNEIDPVVFYSITPTEFISEYEELTLATGGASFDIFDELQLSTSYILNHEESFQLRAEPTFTLTGQNENIGEEAKIVNFQYEEGEEVDKMRFTLEGEKAIILVNDVMMGYMDGGEVEIYDLDKSRENTVTVVAYNREGFPGGWMRATILPEEKTEIVGTEEAIPLSPDCGKL